ncbi:MAG: sugar phosphate isomerase/epimerase [Oscillospiraceae bacterium]|nr:sugar phosphate isomerase/epimerase [Oscillospiraceae bacterium]
MREIGINVNSDIIYGVDPFIDCIKQTGFNTVFTYGNEPDFIAHIADKCVSLGLKYEALHAPWTNINDLWTEGEKGDTVIKMLMESVSLAASHGITKVIIHLSSKENCPHITDAGLLNFDKLVNFAAGKNITIAVENQRKLGNIATILEIYPKGSNVGFCWDNGHEACFAHGREYLPLFGDRCVYTHIHDNNRIYNVDEHLLPYDGQIDFRRVADLLHASGYKGSLTLETDTPREGSDKYASLSLEQFVSKAFAAINRLRILSE